MHTISDLEQLIELKIDDCVGYPNVCNLAQTAEGRSRLIKRVKEIILNDGITDVDTALAKIESDQEFAE